VFLFWAFLIVLLFWAFFIVLLFWAFLIVLLFSSSLSCLYSKVATNFVRWNYYLTFQGKLIFFQFDQYFSLFSFVCVCCVFILLSFYHYGKSCLLKPHYPVTEVSK
jgi:hypothetical protein